MLASQSDLNQSPPYYKSVDDIKNKLKIMPAFFKLGDNLKLLYK